MFERITRAEGVCPALSSYSQAVRAGDLLFVAGQVAADQAGVIRGDTIGEQAERAIGNFEKVVRAAGGRMDRVTFLNVYLKNPEDFDAYNAVHQRHFTEGFPARATMQTGLLGPYLIELWGVVYIGD